MPSENKTVNIGLNQWQGNEYVKREDFSQDNLIVDAKIKELQDGIGDAIEDTKKYTDQQMLSHEDAADPHEQYALDAELNNHKESEMPHRIKNNQTGKTYRYGYQVSTNGIPQVISEEVI